MNNKRLKAHGRLTRTATAALLAGASTLACSHALAAPSEGEPVRQAMLSPAPAPVQIAQNAARGPFSIPRQDMDGALRKLAALGDVQVIYDANVTQGLMSNEVSGSPTPEDALQRMLQGTGLSSEFNGPRSVTIVAQAATETATDASLGTITVQGEGEGAIGAGLVEEQSFGVPSIVIGPSVLENAGDLQDIFTQVPGVSVGSSLPISQKIYVHGIEETNLAVSIDGARQSNKTFHHNATNLIDPSLLKAVRIDPGVAPADAGPGALAGAILFETQDAKDLLPPGKSFGGFVKGGYDTNSNTFYSGGSLYAMGGGFEVLGYYNRVNGDNYTDGNGDEVLGSEANLKSGLGKLAYEAQSGDRFEVSYEQVIDNADRPYRANLRNLVPPRAHEPELRPFDLTRRNLVFTYTDEKPNSWWWDPTILVAKSGTDLYVPYTLRSGAVIDAYGNSDSFSGKFENKFTIAKGDVTAGVDFYDDKAHFIDPFDPATEKAKNVGVYAQARLEFAERLRVSFGGRHDSQDFTGTSGEKLESSGFSGNVSGEFDITRIFTINGGYSHVFAGVPFAEPYIMKNTWSYANVLPVTSDNVVAGLTANYRGFSFEGSIFRTDIHNAQSPEYGTFGAGNGRDVRHEIVSKGYELAGEYQWSQGVVGVNFASVDMTQDGGPITSDAYYIGTPVGQILGLYFSKTIGSTNVTVGGDVQVAFEFDDYEGYVTPGGTVLLPMEGYTVVNLFAEYKPERIAGLTLRAEINNLLDEAYADRASYGGDYSDLLDQLLEPGRSLFVSAKKEF